MRRSALVACATALALAGCGTGGGHPVPRGNPETRHTTSAIDTYAQVEFLRALLVASSDGYYAGGSADDARTQLRRARSAFDSLEHRLGLADAVLDHEVIARFGVVERELHGGATPDHYRDLAGPLADQLMDGVSQALVPPGARSDPGVQAVALRRVVLRLSATYAAAATGAGDPDAALAFQEAWGLWRRAQALNVLIADDLGSARGRIMTALDNLRGSAFPQGPNPPEQPPAFKVEAATTKIVRALDQRFRLSEI